LAPIIAMLGKVWRARPGILALNSTAVATESIRPGNLLRLSDGQIAAALCVRGGLWFAAPLKGLPDNALLCSGEHIGTSASSSSHTAALVPTETLSFCLSDGGKRILDCFGNPLDVEAVRPLVTVARQPLLAQAPKQAELKPICSSLHTGTTAIDALTPVGRGQSMLLIGEEGTGKSTIARDAILAQASAGSQDVHCIVGVSRGGVGQAVAVAEDLQKEASPSLRERLTVVGARSENPVESMLVAAAACAAGEMIRDSGGHALVVLDELSGHLQLWDEIENSSTADAHHIAEQRIFYSALLQRAAQLSDSMGGGSLTIFALVTEALPLPQPVASDGPRFFVEDDFRHHSPSDRARVKLLLSRGISLDRANLQRIKISEPRQTTPSPADDAQLNETRARKACNVQHVDQLKSLADGHIQLHRELFTRGYRPALRPSESLARVGAGSDPLIRPQPSSPAMQQVALSLRLELAQANDILRGCHDAYMQQQQIRTRAMITGLCSQRSGNPRSLSEELALLLALIDGRLDHFGAEEVTEELINRAKVEVDELIHQIRSSVADVMQRIDSSQQLGECCRQELRSALAAHLPHSSGNRALFTSWDVEGDSDAHLGPLK